MKKFEAVKSLLRLFFQKKKDNFEKMSSKEFKDNVISIILNSKSKQEIKDKIRQLGYPYHVSIYYGTSPRKESVNSAIGIPVTTTLFFHPDGDFAIG